MSRNGTGQLYSAAIRWIWLSEKNEGSDHGFLTGNSLGITHWTSLRPELMLKPVLPSKSSLRMRSLYLISLYIRFKISK